MRGKLTKLANIAANSKSRKSHGTCGTVVCFVLQVAALHHWTAQQEACCGEEGKLTLVFITSALRLCHSLAPLTFAHPGALIAGAPRRALTNTRAATV